QILPRLHAVDALSVDADLRTLDPAGNAREQCELGRLRGSYRHLDGAVPGVVCLLRDLQARTVRQVPVQGGVVVEMDVQAVFAGAVEIARQGREGALEIRRAAGGVVPGIADVLARRRVERQRIAIAVQRAFERHARVDAVVQRTLDDVGEL